MTNSNIVGTAAVGVVGTGMLAATVLGGAMLGLIAATVTAKNMKPRESTVNRAAVAGAILVPAMAAYATAKRH